MKAYIKLYILISAALLSISASLFTYNYGSDIGTYRAAKLKLRNEIIQIKKDNISLSEDNEEISKKIEEVDKKKEELVKNDSELKESMESIENYQTQIEALKTELENLDTPAELNSKYSSQIQNISNDIIGESVIYTDTTLVVGTDIRPGRYYIQGDGSFRAINTPSNSITESQNVGLLESDSYTAVIESDCEVIIDGTLTFSPVN